MKKTLIALAVLAASGASFAQVTITGNVTYGYTQSNKNNDLASGLGVDTSTVNFAVKEDLGGGMSADGLINVQDMSRDTFNAGDVSLGLTTGVGRFVLATARSAEYLSQGLGGVSGIGWDGKVMSTRTSRDTASYIVPLTPAFTLLLSHQEAASANAPTGTLGLGKGAAGLPADVGQRLNVVGLTYGGGALAAQLQYLMLDNRTDNSDASAKDQIRAAVTYDFGVAKLGASYVQANATSTASQKDAQVGVTAPMGKVTVGATWAQRKTDGYLVAASNGTKNGVGFSLAYALSKRTGLSATVRNWDHAAQGGVKNDQVDLLVSHSF
jgi:predicted porin